MNNILEKHFYIFLDVLLQWVLGHISVVTATIKFEKTAVKKAYNLCLPILT